MGSLLNVPAGSLPEAQVAAQKGSLPETHAGSGRIALLLPGAKPKPKPYSKLAAILRRQFQNTPLSSPYSYIKGGGRLTRIFVRFSTLFLGLTHFVILVSFPLNLDILIHL